MEPWDSQAGGKDPSQASPTPSSIITSAVILILIIGLSEVRQALAMPYWALDQASSARLPLLAAGSFLLVWSDHECVADRIAQLHADLLRQ